MQEGHWCSEERLPEAGPGDQGAANQSEAGNWAWQPIRGQQSDNSGHCLALVAPGGKRSQSDRAKAEARSSPSHKRTLRMRL